MEASDGKQTADDPKPTGARDRARLSEGLARAALRPWRLDQSRRWSIDAFARRYADAHGLHYEQSRDTPGGALWLAGLERSRSHSFMSGPLGGGADGLMFFAERVVDARKRIYQGWTIARYVLPAARRLTDGLSCVPRLTPAWRGRVHLGSVLPDELTPVPVGDRRFDERHEVGLRHTGDEEILPALFAPPFAEWLDALPFGRHGEAMLRFELRRDVLCVWLREKQRTEAALDAFCANAARVAAHVTAVAHARDEARGHAGEASD